MSSKEAGRRAAGSGKPSRSEREEGKAGSEYNHFLLGNVQTMGRKEGKVWQMWKKSGVLLCVIAKRGIFAQTQRMNAKRITY
ncbi:MAG: hypothetical protein IKP41_08990, partial [Bacteroidaceae bacterium]|nr:hypothetical protein [Bacteroidaceae bacterium]